MDAIKMLETAQLLKDTVKQQLFSYNKDEDICDSLSEGIRGMFFKGCLSVSGNSPEIELSYKRLIYNCYNVAIEYLNWVPKDDKDLFIPSWKPE